MVCEVRVGSQGELILHGHTFVVVDCNNILFFLHTASEEVATSSSQTSSEIEGLECSVEGMEVLRVLRWRGDGLLIGMRLFIVQPTCLKSDERRLICDVSGGVSAEEHPRLRKGCTSPSELHPF